MSEGDVAAVVERVLYDEGWVCNPADHEQIPEPGECINCDGERHRTGYRVFAALRDAGILADQATEAQLTAARSALAACRDVAATRRAES